MSRWELLLAVQEHDTQADQLRHRSATLPVRAEITRVEEDLRVFDQRLAEVDARAGELARSQKRLEDEIASLNGRAEQAEKQLYSGSVTNPRELQALQDDVASIRRRISHLEDEQLEIMELADPVEADRDELLAARAERVAELDRLRSELSAAEAEIEEELAQVARSRAEAAAAVPDDLWPEYDRLRRTRGGVAIARLVGSTCQGCHLTLSAVELDRIRKLPLDEPVHCEECGRLLVRD